MDKPNERSSHKVVTLRGAGVVFVFLLLMVSLYGFVHYKLHFLPHSGTSLNFGKFKNVGFFWGLLIIAVVSFYDDVRPLPPKVRMSIQFVAVALMVVPMGVSWWVMAVALVLIVGTLNAHNFMDGINGITALYSLVGVGTAYAMLLMGYNLVLGRELWLALGASLLAFSFYNVRKKARCFSGDVGAVSVAFVLAYWIFGLVLSEGSLVYILFLGVYGLDAVATIALRLYRKENIFEAHRSHYYQYLANERGWSHVGVSVLYAGLQAVLNGLILWNAGIAIGVYIIMVAIYIRLRL
jgi:UDP-N-acetylmuramyl pentapeptide phosphotransferase/UDP-N-acetylglucosamine-1-phosphate transferase